MGFFKGKALIMAVLRLLTDYVNNISMVSMAVNSYHYCIDTNIVLDTLCGTWDTPNQ